MASRLPQPGVARRRNRRARSYVLGVALVRYTTTAHEGPVLNVNLDPRDARPLYLQILDEVRRALVVGALRAEDPLPSVRELASQLVVNPRTVLQAYRELEREGVIYVRRGQGTFVAPASAPIGPALHGTWRNGRCARRGATG